MGSPKSYQANVIDPDFVPLVNVPDDVQFLEDLKGGQGWLKLEAGRANFPGGSTCGDSHMISRGVAELLSSIGRPLADMHVLDTGCGVGSMATYLANEFAVNMVGFAPVDEHASQTLLASQRGYPVFADALMRDNRFTSPPSQFDAAYCCWCRMHFKEYLYEMQRLLKPGGYLVIDSSPAGYGQSENAFNASYFEDVHMVQIGTIQNGKFVREGSDHLYKKKNTKGLLHWQILRASKCQKDTWKSWSPSLILILWWYTKRWNQRPLQTFAHRHNWKQGRFICASPMWVRPYTTLSGKWYDNGTMRLTEWQSLECSKKNHT